MHGMLWGVWRNAVVAQAGAGEGQSWLQSPVVMIVPLVLIFYFLMFRPQQKQQREQKTMLASLRKGDQVVTSSGIHGVVAGVRDDIVVLKVADNVKIEFSKTAVAAVTKRENEAA